MTTKNIQDVVAERFLKELCWQDTDGKWSLNGTPDTVPNILQFLTQLVKEVEAGEREKTLAVISKNKKHQDADHVSAALINRETYTSIWNQALEWLENDYKARTPITSDVTEK